MKSLSIYRCMSVLWTLILTFDILRVAASLDSGRDNSADGYSIFCYYSSSAEHRSGMGKFIIEDIDPNLCTHIILTFAEIRQGSILALGSSRDSTSGSGLYGRIRDLKKHNSRLKILVSVGGWEAGSEQFVKLARSQSNKLSFIRSAILLLRQHGLDGLDIDWEFPGTRGSDPSDKILYTQLLKDIYNAFQLEHESSGREKLLLTIAVSGGSYYINLAYEYNKMHSYVDYVLLMGYNYHGSWNKFTGHHSALFPRSDEQNGETEWNQAWSIDFWLKEAGVPAHKLILGIPMYGKTFTLTDLNQRGLRAPTNGPGKPGKYTQEPGTLAYYEVCDNIADNWKTVWIGNQKVPYAYSEDQWIGYDDTQSVSYKANYIVEKKLGGAFIWSLELDDFRGTCNEGRYPLLTTVQRILAASPRRSDPMEAAFAGRHDLRNKAHRPVASNKPERLGSPNKSQTSDSDFHKLLELMSKFSSSGVIDRPDLIESYHKQSQGGTADRKSAEEKRYDKDKNYERNQAEHSATSRFHSSMSNARLNRDSLEKPVDISSNMLKEIIAKTIQGYLHNDIPDESTNKKLKILSNFEKQSHSKENMKHGASAEVREDSLNTGNNDWLDHILQNYFHNTSIATSDSSHRNIKESFSNKIEQRRFSHNEKHNDADFYSPGKDSKDKPRYREYYREQNEADSEDSEIARLPNSLPISNTGIGYNAVEDSNAYKSVLNVGKNLHLGHNAGDFHPTLKDTRVKGNHFDDLSSPSDYSKDITSKNTRQIYQKSGTNKVDNLQHKNQPMHVPENLRDEYSSNGVKHQNSDQKIGPGSGMKCDSSGLFPDKSSCRLYYICVPHGSQWFKFSLTCPPGHAFMARSASCEAMNDCLD